MITRLTASAIQCNDELIYTYAQDKETEKYSGWITLPEYAYFRPLLTTEAIFNTSDEAVKHMLDLRDELRSLPSALTTEFDAAYAELKRKQENENSTGH